MSGSQRVVWGEAGGAVIALGGLAAIVCIVALNGAPYLIALASMALGLAPVMVAFYELGGRTPIGIARVSLAVGVAAVLVFAALTLALAAELVSFDESRPATGAFAITAGSMIVFGLWLAIAPVVAGPWLTALPRWLGVVCGLGWAIAGLGLLIGGSENSLTTAGGVGYQLLFPIWGYVIARRFHAARSGRERDGSA